VNSTTLSIRTRKKRIEKLRYGREEKYLGCSWNWNMSEMKLRPMAGSTDHIGSMTTLLNASNSQIEVREKPGRVNSLEQRRG
jgi:hypothetical protein